MKPWIKIIVGLVPQYEWSCYWTSDLCIREMVSAVVNILGDALAAVFIAKTENQIDEKRYHAVTWLE